MRAVVKTLALLAWLVFIPTAFAQAVIAGTVKDASGAVLPGVTVEAASPALIEKVRTAASDGSGQYRIEDLRPGTYTVTFTLPGFSTVQARRHRADRLVHGERSTPRCKVGALAETITVTGESPVVDVQSARREMTLQQRHPQGHSDRAQLQRDGRRRPRRHHQLERRRDRHSTTQFPIHGGRNNEGRMTIDGLNIGNPPGGNQPPAYIADVGNAQEVTFTTAGGLGESETGGLVMNIVPKTGGNSIAGRRSFFSGTGEKLAGDNFTDALRAAGLPAPHAADEVYDLNGAVRRPDQEGRIWYFVNARTQGSTRGERRTSTTT